MIKRWASKPELLEANAFARSLRERACDVRKLESNIEGEEHLRLTPTSTKLFNTGAGPRWLAEARHESAFRHW